MGRRIQVRVDLLTGRGVELQYGLTEAWLRKSRRLGFGPAYVRVGKKAVRYRRSDIERYLEQHTVVPSRERRAEPGAAETA